LLTSTPGRSIFEVARINQTPSSSIISWRSPSVATTFFVSSNVGLKFLIS
jgi:hypothetical protein